MHKHPVGVCLWIPKNKQKAYNEIDSLSIAHPRKVIRYLFEYSLEKCSGFLFEFESAIEIFLNLLEARVILSYRFDLMIRVICQYPASFYFIIADR